MLFAWFWAILTWPRRAWAAIRTFYLPNPLPVKRLPNGKLTDELMPADAAEAFAMAETIGFPSDFMIGTATAAYPVVGGLDNCNWAEWERNGRNGEHYAGKACDVWNLFPEDIARMKSLGLRMYRFSVDWSRIEPIEGRFDDEALARYVGWCEMLHAAGIEPMVTLHHFAEPIWFDQKGGWTVRANVTCFERFAAYAARKLAPHCSYWCTINELNGFAICGYLAGVHPPGIKDDLVMMLGAIRHLMLAHGRAAVVIRKASEGLTRKPTIALPLSHICFMPAGFGLVSYLLPALVNFLFNFAFHEAVVEGRLSPLVTAVFWLIGHRGLGADVAALKGTVDVIGVNHYYRSEVEFGFSAPAPAGGEKMSGPTDLFLRLPGGILLRASPIPTFEKSDMGWDLTPSSMEWLLTALWERFRLPLLVCESGIADGDIPDDRRTRYLAACLAVAAKLRARGVDLRGYLIWTLMDNFEWAEGFRPRFGILRTDFADRSRHERSSTAMVRGVATRDEHGQPV